MRSISKFIPYIIALVLIAFAAQFLYPIFFTKKPLRFPDIVKSPDVNASVAVGKPFHIDFNEDKLSSYDSIVVKQNNVTLATLIDKFTFDLPTVGMPLGNQKIEISVYGGKRVKTVELPFVIVSDIEPEKISFTKIGETTHDPKSYTQGLEIEDGVLYESGGQYGESLIRKVNIKTGAVIESKPIGKEFFTEGLTVLNDKVYQLTWKENVCFVYDKKLNLLDKKNFTGEGWGICNDGKSLIISNGSNRLTYVNPETFVVEKVIQVYAGSRDVTFLNELEYVDGFIFANVYTTDQVVKIEAATGKVLGVLELAQFKDENKSGDVLNGIAHQTSTNTFFITGKYWGKMYEIKL